MDKYDVLVIVSNLLAIALSWFIFIEYARWSNSELWIYCFAVIVASSTLIMYTITKGKNE